MPDPDEREAIVTAEEAINSQLSSIQTQRAIPRPESNTNDEELLQRAYALRFDPENEPPPEELCLKLGDYAIAARSNVSVVQGKSKVGKSAVVAAILGASLRGNYSVKGDLLSFEWQGSALGKVIHFDTEQSPSDWFKLVGRSFSRAGLPASLERMLSIPMVCFSRNERLRLLRLILERESKGEEKIDAVVIDGVADMCVSPNDEAESLELVSQLLALAQEFSVAIICVLHENPSGEGKTRGHLGSELNRKAFANLRVDKDTETSVSTMWGMDMRKRDIPKSQGYCFAWDEDAKMHTFQGRAGAIRAEKREDKKRDETEQRWQKIFDAVGEAGTDSNCPGLSVKEAVAIIGRLEGKAPKDAAVKKQMQRAEAQGVLRKTETGRWSLNRTGPSGQSGTNESPSPPLEWDRDTPPFIKRGCVCPVLVR